MINIDKLKLYPFATRDVAYSNQAGSGEYNLIIFPENTTFGEAYSKMMIRRMFVRKATLVMSTIPRVLFNGDTMSSWRTNKLIPIRKIDSNSGNVFIDTSFYLDGLDDRFGKGSYRRPIVSGKIKSYLTKSAALGSIPGRKNVLLYYVDLTKPLSKNILSRRIWPALEVIKRESKLPVDYFLLGINTGGTIRYSLLSNPEKALGFARIYTILRSLQATIMVEDPVEKNVQISKATNKILSGVEAKSQSEMDKMASAVGDYLRGSDPNKKHDINSKQLSKDEAEDIVLKSILYKAVDDPKRVDALISRITPENRAKITQSVRDNLLPDIIEHDKYKNRARDSVYGKVDMHAINDNKEPSQIMNKRALDFNNSFEKDMINTLKMLSNKSDYPLKMTGFRKESVAIDPGDLEPSKETRYIFTMEDAKGKKHDIDIKIPELQSDGTFMINGAKKFIIYQIVLDPIFFLKEGVGKLETLYAASTVRHKKTKYKSYYELYLAGYNFPVVLLMSYYLGFDGFCKLFNVTYKIGDVKPEDEAVLFFPLSDGKFLIFNKNNETWLRIIKSMYEIDFEFTSENIGIKETFQEAVVKHVGNRNCVYKINSVLENIMEPVSVEILKTKLLPVNFEGCIRYICEELTKGRVDKRNDLANQRIRSSEVFTFQIQKLILSAYNDYRQRRVYGDDNAEFFVDARQVVSGIVNSQLVRNLENINPLEELSSMTRITPVGDGGIPDKMALDNKAKSIDDSYYGNIDPMDTPENGMIGIINQLTMDAAIANARGSFKDKTGIEDDKAGMLSPMAAVLPYVNSCDGARVMLYCSQTKQAIPITDGELPLVQTGYESILSSMLSDSYIKKSTCPGKVQKITENIIQIKCDNGRLVKLPLGQEKLNSGQGQNSLNTFHPVVKIGQSVKAGEIVAEGKHLNDGVISIGTNLLTGIMGWKGYEFEDGYIISDYVAEQKMRSISYDEIEVYIRKEDKVTFINVAGKDTLKGEPLIMRVSKEIDELVSLEEGEFVEGQIVKKSPGGKIIAIEVYPNMSLSRFPALHEPYENFKSKWQEMKGDIPKKFLVKEGGKSVPFTGIKVVFKIQREEVTIVGDKVANSHGGKGVVAYIEKRENMPITPWGEPLDIILNPIAIINRMNPSTILEMYSGLIGKFLAHQLVEMGPKKTQKALKLVHDVYTSMDNTPNKKLSKSIVQSYSSMSDKAWADYMNTIKARKYIVPVYAPPFQAPTKEQLYKAITLLGGKPSYHLKLPEYGGKTLNPIACGYLYYKKNEQQSSLKMSARSVGRYRSKTLQPTAGKKAGGGQRLGEFDSWGMISHGAENVLREMMGPLSDDQATKNEIISEIVQTGEAGYKDPKQTPTKDLFETYMHGLMLAADVTKIEKKKK